MPLYLLLKMEQGRIGITRCTDECQKKVNRRTYGRTYGPGDRSTGGPTCTFVS